ncbi:unnamed protein product [Owenia fusiformis]|uniref:Uncharacterized protein n=1 Tax=Owenia fusiformis TaxID=6347 RepID=A0A8J1TTC9_OWEFU|nr:unnamed protein product [Owenia fusiformis]
MDIIDYNTSSNNEVEISSNDQLYDDYYDFDIRAQTILGKPDKIVVMTLGGITVIANFISLLAIRKIKGEMTPHRMLMVSLALSDILVSISIMVHLVNSVVNPGPKFPDELTRRLHHSCGRAFVDALITTAHIISLLNLLGMAIDHYIAIIWAIHYEQLLDKNRCKIMIIILWVISVICGLSDFYPGETFYGSSNLENTTVGYYGLNLFDESTNTSAIHFLNYCELASFTEYKAKYLIFAIAFLSIVGMVLIYTNIFLVVRRQTRFMQRQMGVAPDSKKAVITTLLIVGTFMLCVMPMTIFQFVMMILGILKHPWTKTEFQTLMNIQNYSYIFLVLNSLLDPFIYAARMRDVRRGYVRLFHPCCKQPNNNPNSYFVMSTSNATHLTSLGNNDRSVVTAC